MHPLWGQREDKQIQASSRRRCPAAVQHHRAAHRRLCPRASAADCSARCRHLLQSLLEMVSVGAASMEELKERLEAELAALEVGWQ